MDELGLVTFADKNLKGKVCLSPFISFEISVNGDISLCHCNAWMPSPVGNLFESSLEEILSNQKSRAIRQSIIDGNYRYCNEKTCGVLNHNQLNQGNTVPPVVQQLLDDSTRYVMPHEIRIAGDLTCNLSCPSCRIKIIKSSPEEIDRRKQLGRQLSQNLFSFPTTKQIKIHVSTSGEIFASPLLLEFVQNMPVDDFPGLELCIQTNGLLMENRWERLGAMADRVTMITVTTDAARPDTYEKLRRGGNWHTLEQNLKWLQQKKQDTAMKFHMRMVVQHGNYQEIEEFYNYSKQLGADVVEYGRITDWGTFGNRFVEHDVFDPAHPEHNQAQQYLNLIRDKSDIFLSGGI